MRAGVQVTKATTKRPGQVDADGGGRAPGAHGACAAWPEHAWRAKAAWVIRRGS